MAKMHLLLITVALVGVFAEPPVPNSYSPPSQNGARTPESQYGVPMNEYRALSFKNGASKATNQIGNASARFGGVLSNQYGTPSAAANSFSGLATVHYGAPAPSVRNSGASGAVSRFSASGSTRSFSGALSTGYGALLASPRIGSASTRIGTAPSTRYGIPSTSGGSFSSSLSTQYGAPATLSRPFDNALSGQYAVPSASKRDFGNTLSTQYGAPAASKRAFGAISTQSASGRSSAVATQYGVPAANSIYIAGGGYAASARNLAREDDLAEPASYEFSYKVQDAESGAAFSQEEARQDEKAQGSYRVLLPNGRLQIVEYEADPEGYKPRIRYEDNGAGSYARSGPQQREGLEGPY